MKRKIGVITLILIMLTVMFTACAQEQPTVDDTDDPPPAADEAPPADDEAPPAQDAGEQEQVTVVWFAEPMDIDEVDIRMRYLINPFNEAFPHINIELNPTPDYEQALRVQMAGGAGPDLCFTGGPTMANEFAAAGMFVDLTDKLDEAGLTDTIFPWALNACKFDGRVFSMPDSYEALLLWYNRTMFEEMGWQTPTNYRELTVLCEAIQDEGLIPIAFGTSDFRVMNEWFVSIIMTNYIGNEGQTSILRGEMDWNDSLMYSGISLLNDMWQRGWINERSSHAISGADSDALFMGQLAAMRLTGTWTLSNFRAIEDFQYGMTLFPSLREGLPPAMPLGSGGAIGINAASDVIEESWEILRFWFERTDLMLEAVASGEQPLPVFVDFDDFPKDRMPEIEIEVYSKMLEAMANPVNLGFALWTNHPPATRLHLAEMIESVFLGEMTVEEYLNEAQRLFEGERDTVPPIQW